MPDTRDLSLQVQVSLALSRQDRLAVSSVICTNYTASSQALRRPTSVHLPHRKRKGHLQHPKTILPSSQRQRQRTNSSITIHSSLISPLVKTIQGGGRVFQMDYPKVQNYLSSRLDFPFVARVVVVNPLSVASVKAHGTLAFLFSLDLLLFTAWCKSLYR